MKSNSFYKTLGIIVFAMVNLMYFTLPTYAQKTSKFTAEINNQANTVRLPVAGSSKYIQITAVSKSDGIAFVDLPENSDSETVRAFKWLISDGAFGFIGVIEHYNDAPTAAILVAITPEWKVYYQIFHEDTMYVDGSFPFTGIQFYDLLKREDGLLFTTTSVKDAYDALIKWANKHVTHRKE